MEKNNIINPCLQFVDKFNSGHSVGCLTKILRGRLRYILSYK